MSLSKSVLNLKFMQRASTAQGKPLPAPEARKELPAEASARWSLPISQLPKPKGKEGRKVVYENSYAAFEEEEEDKGEGSSNGRMKFGPKGVVVKKVAPPKPTPSTPTSTNPTPSASPSLSSPQSTPKPTPRSLPKDSQGFAPPSNLLDMPSSSSQSQKRKKPTQPKKEQASLFSEDEGVLHEGARGKKQKKKGKKEKSGGGGEGGEGDVDRDAEEFLKGIKDELMA